MKWHMRCRNFCGAADHAASGIWKCSMMAGGIVEVLCEGGSFIDLKSAEEIGCFERKRALVR